jgi:hypothetical protein
MRLLAIESLDTEWTDRDYLMLHACFQILKDFVEQENGLECCLSDDRKELETLYSWWVERCKDEEYDNDREDKEMLQRLIDKRQFLWS